MPGDAGVVDQRVQHAVALRRLRNAFAVGIVSHVALHNRGLGAG